MLLYNSHANKINLLLKALKTLQIQGLSSCRRTSSSSESSATKFENGAPKDLRSNQRKVCVQNIYLNIREEGHGSHNLLLLPGFLGINTIMTDLETMYEKMDKTKFRLISWDPTPYETVNMKEVRLIEQLMQVLEYSKYSVVGWSWGALTATTLASVYSHRVTNLVLWGAQAHKALNETLIENQNCGSYQHQHQGSTSASSSSRISGINCPTLIFHDPSVNVEDADNIAKNIPTCKVKILQDARNDMEIINSKIFFQEMDKFLFSPPKGISA